MDTRFDGIAELVAVTRLGSFTAVAAELGMTKSAVGRAVSRLEALQVTRPNDTSSDLDACGEAWLEHCIAALAELDRGESALILARDTPYGH